MNTNDLTIFLTIVKTNTISGAASALFLSPSTVGARLKALEDELGFSVIQRSKGAKSVQLTDKGRAFVPYAEKWIQLWNDTLMLKNEASAERFALCSSSTFLHFLSDSYKSFIAAHPQLQLDISIQDSDVAYMLVQQGKIDAGLIVYPSHVNGVVTEELFREELVLVASPKHKLPTDEYISIHSLPLEDLLLLPTDGDFYSWYKKHIPFHNGGLLKTNSAFTLTELFDPERSWTIVSATEALYLKRRMNVQLRRIIEAPPARSAYLITNANKLDFPYMHTFRSILNKSVEEGKSSGLLS